jgi:putative transposase
MDSKEKELHRQRIADFRYSVVAELCKPYLSEEKRKSLIRDKVSRHYVISHSKKATITTDTIGNWIKRYQRNGKDGLLPKPRTDRGRPRSFTDQEAKASLMIVRRIKSFY